MATKNLDIFGTFLEATRQKETPRDNPTGVVLVAMLTHSAPMDEGTLATVASRLGVPHDVYPVVKQELLTDRLIEPSSAGVGVGGGYKLTDAGKTVATLIDRGVYASQVSTSARAGG